MRANDARVGGERACHLAEAAMRADAAVDAAVVAGAGPEHPKWRAPRIMAPHATRLPKQLQPLEGIRELIPQLLRWNARANGERRCDIVVAAVSIHGSVVGRNSKAVADACAVVATCSSAFEIACAAVGLLVTAAAVARATGWQIERVGEEGRGWFVGKEAALEGAHQLCVAIGFEKNQGSWWRAF